MKNLVIVILSTLLTLCVMEGVLHTPLAEKKIMLSVCGIKVKFQGWLTTARYYQPDPVVGYSGLPYANGKYPNKEHAGGFVVNTRNNLGLVGSRNTARRKPEGVFRILVLGDSQTEGLSLCNSDETFPHVLEQLLNQHRPDLRVEVLNAGVSGYNPLQYFLWYKRYGEELHPDLVVMSVYVGNDVIEMNRFSMIRSLRLVQELSDGSSRLLFLCKALGVNRRLGIQTSIANLSDSWHPGVDIRLGHIWAQSLLQNYFQKQFPDQFKRALTMDFQVLSLMNEEARREKTRWMVFLIPSKLQVEPEDDIEQTERAMKPLHLAWSDITAEKNIERSVARFCQGNGISFLDATSALSLQHRLKKQRLFGKLHWHLNPQGQRSAAELLENYLRPLI